MDKVKLIRTTELIRIKNVLEKSSRVIKNQNRVDPKSEGNQTADECDEIIKVIDFILND